MFTTNIWPTAAIKCRKQFLASPVARCCNPPGNVRQRLPYFPAFPRCWNTCAWMAVIRLQLSQVGAFSCSNKCSFLMWAPINTSSILQSAKAEIWEQCCTALLETHWMAPCNMERHFHTNKVISTQGSSQKGESFQYKANSNKSVFENKSYTSCN